MGSYNTKRVCTELASLSSRVAVLWLFATARCTQQEELTLSVAETKQSHDMEPYTLNPKPLTLFEAAGAVKPVAAQWSGSGSNVGALTRLPPPLWEQARARVRLLPYLISKQNPAFVMRKCSFKVSKSKMGTGRVVVCRELGVPNSYTIEARTLFELYDV